MVNFKRNTTREIFCLHGSKHKSAIEACRSNSELMLLSEDIDFWVGEPQINDYSYILQSNYDYLVTHRRYLTLHKKSNSKINNTLYTTHLLPQIALYKNIVILSGLMNGMENECEIFCSNPDCGEKLSNVNKGILGVKKLCGQIHHINVINGDSYYKDGKEPSELISQINCFSTPSGFVELILCVCLCDTCHTLIHSKRNLSLKDYPDIIPKSLKTESEFDLLIKTLAKDKFIDLDGIEKYFMKKFNIPFMYESVIKILNGDINMPKIKD